MARTIPPEKMEAYKRGALAREVSRRQKAAQRRKEAWAIAESAARVLRREFRAERVIAFGSLVHGAWFRSDSDIDLAVEGIEPDVFWRAWCRLDQISKGFEINLVPLEDASESLRREIETGGHGL